MSDVPDAHKQDGRLPHYCCPACKERGHWRRGMYFEHQMICGKCDEVWCPDDIERYRKVMGDLFKYQNGDGI